MAKKKGGGAGWLATFADLMSLLMAFFVLLFAMSSTDKAKYEALVKSLTQSLGHGADLTQTQVQYFQQTKTQKKPSENTGTAEKSPIELKPLYNSLIQTYASETARGDVKVEMTEDGKHIRITFPDRVAFDPGRANLKPEFIRMLRKNTDLIKKPDIMVKVLGHTDSRPIHSFRFKNNWELSSARAAAVIGQLIKDGVIRKDQAVAIGLADTRPLVPGNTPEALRKNRRVEILIAPKTDPL